MNPLASQRNVLKSFLPFCPLGFSEGLPVLVEQFTPLLDLTKTSDGALDNVPIDPKIVNNDPYSLQDYKGQGPRLTSLYNCKVSVKGLVRVKVKVNNFNFVITNWLN